jgi:hypothetical protein
MFIEVFFIFFSVFLSAHSWHINLAYVFSHQQDFYPASSNRASDQPNSAYITIIQQIFLIVNSFFNFF